MIRIRHLLASWFDKLRAAFPMHSSGHDRTRSRWRSTMLWARGRPDQRLRKAEGKPTAALIFSRFHWENQHQSRVGSGRMQQEAFQSLQTAGFTTYFAGQEDPAYPKEIVSADIICSLAPGLLKLRRSKRSIRCLYTCNTHVTERIRRLKVSSKRWNLPCEEWPDERMFKAAYDAADYLLIAENDMGMANFIRNGISPEKIRRYNNAVDVDVWVPNPNKRTKFTFVCWSSAHGLRKGLPALVTAWRNWFRGQDAELHLVGIPTTVSKLLFGNANNCEYMPGLHLNFELFPAQHKPIVDFLGSCHVAVFPTLEDAEPSSLLEMAACGLPVITTVESGVEFTSDFCRYIAADDPDSLSDALDFWFQRKDEVAECANLARKYILEHHTWRHFRQRFVSIIQEADRERIRRMNESM